MMTNTHSEAPSALDITTDLVVAAAAISVSVAVILGYRLWGNPWLSGIAVFSLTFFQAWRVLALDFDKPVQITPLHWRKFVFAISGGLSTWAFAALVMPDAMASFLLKLHL